MKSVKSNLFLLLSICIAAFAVIVFNPLYADAKVKDGTYYFSSCRVSSFKVKGGKMTLKVAGSEGITKKGSSSFNKKKMTVKVNKNCKYYISGYERLTGKKSRYRATYKEVKKSISFDSSWYKKNKFYNNRAYSYFVVKNGKIVKIIYFWL